MADFGSQAVICRALGITFPDDPIIAEEDAEELGKSGNTAVLDEVVALGASTAGSTPMAIPPRPRSANGSTGGEAASIATGSGQLIRSMEPKAFSATSSTPWLWR